MVHTSFITAPKTFKNYKILKNHKDDKTIQTSKISLQSNN
jgi:hypothetical protein